MPLQIDASSPGGVKGNGSTGVTSPTFSPPADSLVLVIPTACGLGFSDAYTTGVTDSVGSTYTPLAQQYSPYSDTEVWSTYLTSAQTDMTVSASFAGVINNTKGATLTVLVLTGASPSQPGTTATGTTSTVSVTPQSVGSIIFGAIATGSSTTAYSTNANTSTEFGSAGVTSGFSSFSSLTFRSTDPTSSLTATSYGASNSLPNQNICAVEILPAGGSSSSYDPASITGLVRHYKADDITGNDNDPIAAWPDSSGNGVDATQATGTNQPVLKTDILNGHAVVRFSGSQFMEFALQSGVSASYTYVIIANPTSLAGGPQTLIGSSGDWPQGISFYIGAYGDAGKLIMGRASVDDFAKSSNTTTAGSFHVYAGALNATNNDVNDVWNLWHDGASFGFGAAGVAGGSTASTSYIGAYYKSGSANNLFTGDIAEILVYDRALSDSSLAVINSYAQDVYGITVSDYGQTIDHGSAIVAWLTA